MERVIIGANYLQQPMWKKAVGVPLVYFPLITTTPFVLLGVLLVRTHLKYVGAMNIRSYWDFVPAWISHRYRNDNQIIYTTGSAWYNLRAHRFYWIFNCKLYCPLSVALFRYAAYLVMIVENWWCPFTHDQNRNMHQEQSTSRTGTCIHRSGSGCIRTIATIRSGMKHLRKARLMRQNDRV